MVNLCFADQSNDIYIKNNQCHDIKHMHLLICDDINVKSLIEDISYDTISFDIISCQNIKTLELLDKYINKTEIIFCNNISYNIFKQLSYEVPLIVMINNNGIVVLEKEINRYYETEITVITNGAMECFIRNVLSLYFVNRNIDMAIKQSLHFITKSKIITYELPQNIIIIGNSCGGKTTCASYLKQLFDIYNDIDDIEPLKEVFLMDELISNNRLDDFKHLKEKLVYALDIWNEYNKDIKKAQLYTKESIKGACRYIFRPILWDNILKYSVQHSKKQNNIIQFSRGYDKQYEDSFKENVYYRSIKNIIDNIDNPKNTLIINLVSNFMVRNMRNGTRFLNGGHYVADEIMNNVYYKDFFDYFKTANDRGYFKIGETSIPVFTIKNSKNLSNEELKFFFNKRIYGSIKYYNVFKTK